MRQKVIVVGAGVAGLTAAHELIERDFEVHVVERRQLAGGKALSRRTAKDLPTEHGFRFFPGWYRHLPDTMRRIPFKGRRQLYEGRTTYDNLISVQSNLLAWYDRDPIEAPMHLPRSFDQLKTLHSFFWDMMKLDLGPAEMSTFLTRLAQFMAMPESERRERLTQVTWWQFLDADNKSRAFQDLISATTRTMVAAKATEASAYTICRLAIRTLFDAVSSVDRILNGPTNEKWIDPWIEYLDGRGVKFHWGWELESIKMAETEPVLASLEYGFVLADSLRRLRHLLAPIGADVRTIIALVPSDEGSGPLRQSLRRRFLENAKAFRELHAELVATCFAKDAAKRKLAIEPAHLEELRTALAGCEDFVELSGRAVRHHDKLWDEDRAKPLANRAKTKFAEDARPSDWSRKRARIARIMATDFGLPEATYARSASTSPVGWLAEYFSLLENATPAELPEPEIFPSVDLLLDEQLIARLDDALRFLERNIGSSQAPPEQADYYVFALPVEQMAYHVNRSTAVTAADPDLRKIVPLSGYVDWMAGIQFYLQERVELGRGHIVAMDSEWALTAIEQEQFWDDLDTWPDQVKAVLSVDIAAWDRQGRFVHKEAFNCTDQEIAEEVWNQLSTALSNDRGPQRLRKSMLVSSPEFKKGVNYMLDESIVDLCDRRKQGAYERARSARASATADRPNPFGDAVPYMWGPRFRFNVEPLLVNRVGSHQLRPEAKTKISNMFLASDYVRTETDLACMEGANEAARRAVNALLEVAGSREKPCEVWDFSMPSGLLDQLSSLARIGNPGQIAGEATRAAGKAADVAIDMVARTATALRGLWEKR
jgi:hypothetical protein